MAVAAEEVLSIDIGLNVQFVCFRLYTHPFFCFQAGMLHRPISCIPTALLLIASLLSRLGFSFLLLRSAAIGVVRGQRGPGEMSSVCPARP